MKIFLDDTKCKDSLLPFTLTRNVADIRIGIFTIREKWEKLTGYNFCDSMEEGAIAINANILPTKRNYLHVLNAAKERVNLLDSEEMRVLHHPWQIFEWNGFFLKEDFDLLTGGKISAKLSQSNRIIGDESKIFIEEGVSAECSVFNTNDGPIYIGKNTLIMEGSLIRGPFAAGENCVLKMGTKIYGATTAGPHCILGGEIKNSVFFGHSNKAHDGYIGDSVIGEWCNLGAGTCNSNIKNTASPVKYFLKDNTDFLVTGNKAGLLMGDYSRTAINTSFNTGAVVGVSCNIFAPVMHMKHIPSFTWGNDRYHFDRAISDIDNWKKMKGRSISDKEKEILWQLYNTNS